MKDPKANPVVLSAAAETSPGKPIQRWNAARKRDVVLRLLRGESVEAVSRQIGIEPHRLEQWRERALAALTVAAAWSDDETGEDEEPDDLITPPLDLPAGPPPPTPADKERAKALTRAVARELRRHGTPSLDAAGKA